MTDSQSASLSWNKAPIWGLRPDFYYRRTTVGLLMWGTLSLTRGRVCRLHMLLALASAVILETEPLGTHDHILLSQIRDFPFRRLLRLAGSRWWYSTPPPHGYPRTLPTVPSYNPRHVPRGKHRLYCKECVFTGPLPSNGYMQTT
jgi:hypothetical protein